MKRNRMIATAFFAMLVPAPALSIDPAVAQQASDTEAVKAASDAFYTALSRINTPAMEELWAHRPYVVYVGPRNKAILRGWDAVKKALEDGNSIAAQRSVKVTESDIQTDGKLAWEVGVEIGQVKLKNGSEVVINFIATNIYEKINGRWLMVSHHVQPKPQ